MMRKYEKGYEDAKKRFFALIEGKKEKPPSCRKRGGAFSRTVGRGEKRNAKRAIREGGGGGGVFPPTTGDRPISIPGAGEKAHTKRKMGGGGEKGSICLSKKRGSGVGDYPPGGRKGNYGKKEKEGKRCRQFLQGDPIFQVWRRGATPGGGEKEDSTLLAWEGGGFLLFLS